MEILIFLMILFSVRKKKHKTNFLFYKNQTISIFICYLCLAPFLLVKIYYLKYSYVLMFTNSNGIMVKYDSFTKGNFEDFKEFIKENCKKAKIIIKNKNYFYS